MTVDQLIERAARALAATQKTVYMGRASQHYIDLVTAALRSLAPDDSRILERLADLASGEAWIAPNAITEAMRDAADDAEEDMQRTGHGQGAATIWAAMRSAALNQTDGDG